MSVTNRLVFDPTDANSIAASSSIGSYVRAGSDGDLIASQTLASEEWLNVAGILHDKTGSAIDSSNPLPVDVTGGVNVEVDLSHVDDSVALGDGTSLLTSTTVGADIGLDVNVINAEIDVNLQDGAGTDLTSTLISGKQSLDVNVAGFSVSDVDIRDLTHVSDSVALGDGTNLLTSTTVGSDIGLDVNILNASDIDIDDDLADTAIANTATAVSTTAVNVVASALASRKWMGVANEGNKSLYFGKTGVTTSNGFPLHPGMQQVWRVGASVTPQIIGGNGASSEDLRVIELS